MNSEGLLCIDTQNIPFHRIAYMLKEDTFIFFAKWKKHHTNSTNIKRERKEDTLDIIFFVNIKLIVVNMRHKKFS